MPWAGRSIAIVSPHEGRTPFVELADQHQVERQSSGSGLVGRATGQLFQGAAQRRLVADLHDIGLAVQPAQRSHPPLRRLGSRHRHHKADAAPPSAPDQVDLDHHAGVGPVRVDEAGDGLPGRDRAAAVEAEGFEVLAQRRIAFVVERALVQKGDFERREIFRVQPGRQEVERSLAVVLDLQPERLDAVPVEVDAENGSGFVLAGDRRRDPNAVVGLGLRPRAQRPVVDRRRPLEGGGASPGQQEQSEADGGHGSPRQRGAKTTSAGHRRSSRSTTGAFRSVGLALGTRSQSRTSTWLGGYGLGSKNITARKPSV
jgi:hypothetical protein